MLSTSLLRKMLIWNWFGTCKLGLQENYDIMYKGKVQQVISC